MTYFGCNVLEVFTYQIKVKTMMNKTLSKAVLTIAISVASLSASANVIIDTGSALFNNGAIALGNIYGDRQSVAAGISLAESYSITDLSSYFWTDTSGTLTVSLYADSSGAVSSKLYSQSFTISSDRYTKTWAGVSGLNWSVDAGNYWVAYEVLNGQTFFGALEFPAERPLQMVVKNNYYTDWTNHVGLSSFALVISGNSIAPVPEADTSAMLLTGLGVIGFIVRRRKNIQA
jgi:hypothetical protein